MKDEIIKINMLGEFSITLGTNSICDSDNRARKVWLLLAYLIYLRNRTITQSELIGMLWGGKDSNTNPKNALKTIFHRVRTMLNQLDEDAGHILIVRHEDKYLWNTDIEISFDAEEFDSLCAESFSIKDPNKRLNLELIALSLYKGDFLANFVSESWITPINVYYHNLYVRLVHDSVAILEELGRYDDLLEICIKAITIEPYDEGIYQYMMRAYLQQCKYKEAISIYHKMSETLFDAFGVVPSTESKLLYQEANYSVNEREVTHAQLIDLLKEPNPSSGALFCDYDFFKVIYQAEARSVSRNGYAVHIALISVQGENRTPLAKRSLKVAMENLKEIICANLRKGDIASCCSISQYILLIPQANYENSCLICDRIVKAFGRQYPHSPAILNYYIQPMEPNL